MEQAGSYISVLYITSMQSYYVTNDDKELVVKRNKQLFFFYGIVWVAMLSSPIYNLHETVNSFKRHPVTSGFIYLLMISVGIFLWYGIFSHSVQLVINKKGMWTKRSKLVEWNNIYYYHFVKGKHQSKTTWTFKFKIVEPEKIYSLDLFSFDKGYEDIIKAIEDNASVKIIHYLDVDDYS